MGVRSPLGTSVAGQAAALRAGGHGIRRMPEWAVYKGLRSLLAAPAELKDEKAIPRVTVHGVSLLTFPPAACGTE